MYLFIPKYTGIILCEYQDLESGLKNVCPRSHRLTVEAEPAYIRALWQLAVPSRAEKEAPPQLVVKDHLLAPLDISFRIMRIVIMTSSPHNRIQIVVKRVATDPYQRQNASPQ